MAQPQLYMSYLRQSRSIPGYQKLHEGNPVYSQGSQTAIKTISISKLVSIEFNTHCLLQQLYDASCSFQNVTNTYQTSDLELCRYLCTASGGYHLTGTAVGLLLLQ